ncbi:MAG: hypothetical protein ACOC3V_03365 [bacterium]
MFKRAKVVMLPTNEKAGTIWLNTKGQLLHTHVSDEYKELYKPQHLYILSDEKIKEGDWMLRLYDNTIHQATRGDVRLFNENKNGHKDDFRKIIATTDKFLCLPKPSDSFIQKYIEKYNEGKSITDVLVEYWTYTPGIDEDGYGFPVGHPITIPSVSTKDNTITIKKVKDSWTEEDVSTKLNKLAIDLFEYVSNKEPNGLDPLEESWIKKWIEQNL